MVVSWAMMKAFLVGMDITVSWGILCFDLGKVIVNIIIKSGRLKEISEDV